MAGGSDERDADGASEAARALMPPLAGRSAAVALTLLALANLAAGLAIAFDAERVVDFTQVVAWSAEWLRGGDPYAAPASIADYPPPALVVFAPLAMVPSGTALAAWVALNAAGALAIAWMSARLAAPRAASAAFALLVLALPPFRTLNQFSIAAFAAALAGFLLAPRRPALAGVAIGLSLIKPHIGGPALLWALASRRWATAAWAAGTQVVLLGAYMARAGAAPHVLIDRYLGSLARAQNRNDLIGGETSLEPLLAWTSFEPLTIQVLLALALGIVLARLWQRAPPDLDHRFFAGACLVSLLTFRHLSYNLLLAIPALAWTLASPRLAGRMTGIAAAAVLVASPSTLWRHVLDPAGAWIGFEPLATHAYRVALAALFVAVVSLSARTPSVRRQSSA